MFPLLSVTTLPVQVHQANSRKQKFKTERLRVVLVKVSNPSVERCNPKTTSEKGHQMLHEQHNCSDCSTFLVLCKLGQRKTPQEDVTPESLPANIMADPAFDFQFLHDAESRKLIRTSKVLFIMRGLPGSGKSTIVKAITSTYSYSIVCSADDYFLKDGAYRFNGSLLGSAHNACQSKAKDACNEGIPVIVIDNTNVRRWEMKFYLDLASHQNYVVVLVEPKTPWKWNAGELAMRNKHSVDVQTLKRKVDQFDDVIPVYYAWFLNEAASKNLLWISRTLLKECLQHFPDLSSRLFRQLHQTPPEDREALWKILQEYYTNRGGCLVHCTAKFCGGGRVVGAKTYHAKPCVQNSLGKAFTLVITSVCFSPCSTGARVQLSEEQMQLFDKPEEREWNGVPPKSSAGYADGTAAKASTGSPGQSNGTPRQKGGSGKSSQGKKNSARPTAEPDAWSDSLNRMQLGTDEDLSPARTRPLATSQGRSAHITLGSAQGFGARETNYDVLRLCDMEHAVSEGDLVPVSGGRAQYFGDGVCCVYFNTPLQVQTLYSGFY